MKDLNYSDILILKKKKLITASWSKLIVYPMAENSNSSVTEKLGLQNSSVLPLKNAQSSSVLQFFSMNFVGIYSLL